MIVSDKHLKKMLSPAEMQAIHAGTCKLLEQTGVKVTHEGIVEMLLSRGAERKGDRICIPRDMVENAIADTAKSIKFDAPDPAYGFTVNAAENQVKFGTGGQALYVVDRTSDGWEKRSAGTEDLKQILALCNKLKNVDFITRPVECDVPDDQMDVEKARIFSEYCSKPMNLANLIKKERLDEVLEIIGDPAHVSFIVCLVLSPLVMDNSAGDKLIALLEKDLPVAISSCPQGGSTAPLSEVGELLQINAELLFGYVLANAIRPGAKVLYRGIPITSNLYTDGTPRWCQPESIRRVALAAQLCRYYNLPCCGTAAVSDEEVPSAQGISEKVLSLVYESASGAQYTNSALGMLQQVMSVSPYQYVIDDTLLGIVKEKFSEDQSGEIAKLAKNAAVEGLSRFGVSVDDKIEAELDARIRYIETPLEPYSEEYIDKQLAAIEKAATSSGGSTVFMRSARKGLREGYLYSGNRIDAPLDLSNTAETLKTLLTAKA
ncbi:trimethylamine--corrinoid methyltransferase [Dethiobacter alkaliphilus]|uniref:Trimethylamine:corrinoid methyltransferase-like protein n=1 Tax=Dethiobacter alkaliphilus AHT 1 TaxID=555088 RepID=C0GFP9_DETAL|nr:trimethylamine--corrinoid methyltransferase [Dethiobacter alkaliphilus]EEG78009.1 Trimethylamine:corrinoid methyltransferase-like protein [Dethiobacter alkaliphilus AHT 1]